MLDLVFFFLLAVVETSVGFFCCVLHWIECEFAIVQLYVFREFHGGYVCVTFYGRIHMVYFIYF